jgi:putative nucleotidyltransferase with HDIG domain
MIAAGKRAADWIHEARARERAGCVPEAIAAYEAAIKAAGARGEPRVLAEALRRLAVVRHHRNEESQARSLGEQSYRIAQQHGDEVLAAEALNTLGGFDLRTGALDQARQRFLEALDRGDASRALRARVEQNLGIVANIQGDLPEALRRYEASLEAYRSDDDAPGCAIAYHNLAMASADRGQLDQAELFFRESYDIARRLGDVHLQGLCLVNHAEVHVARQRYDDARRSAEEALVIFDQVGAHTEKAEAYRALGMVYRETGRPALAESRLRSAIDLARGAGSVLSEAESSRELAVLYQTMGRNQEALTLLNAAHRLFRRLDARVDLVNVDGKVAALEGTYLAVVREWGQSIEASDTYTFGHCERVAQGSVALASVLGLDDDARQAVRLGAYLHDVGKVRVPHEILTKPGPLTRDEFAIVQMHPIWGIELLAAVEFPWDLKPIIRWHHEKYDGSGYPDGLRGDEIPLAAQIVGIVDVYDALTTARPYRPALSHAEAIAEIERCRRWWSEEVVAAFLQQHAQPNVNA